MLPYHGPLSLNLVRSCPTSAKAGLGLLGAASDSVAQEQLLVEVCSNDDSSENERLDFSGSDYSLDSGHSTPPASSSGRRSPDSNPCGALLSSATPSIVTPIHTEAGSTPVTGTNVCKDSGAPPVSSPGIPPGTYQPSFDN